MRTRLIFVRHGESVHTVERFIGGRHGCRGLTATGREQAARLADRLAGELAGTGPVAVYSSELRRAAEVPGGGVHRPFQRENETWAELVVRAGRSIMDIAHRHAGQAVVLVGHSETVNAAFHTLGAQPLLRAFDTVVAPASITEWAAEEHPTGSPWTRWTLHRFSA
jgi:probable phosphoglycerate mutase